ATLSVNPPSTFTKTALVADTAASGALIIDTNLVNPWGIAFGASFAWVANNHSETSTLYDGNGKAQPTSAPFAVNFPPNGAVSFDPTGVVLNGTTSFVVTAAAKSAAATFLFVGEGGMIAGWSATVDPANAVVAYTDAGGAVYKGLAIANNGSSDFLYAADFYNGKVDVFGPTFAKQTPTPTSFTFTDPTLPTGYAPFGIAALRTGPSGAVRIYVSYAQQLTPANHDNTNGPGLGLVDVYDANGQFISHLIATGKELNAPWGMALAPADFGTLSSALLVGNFGDGKVNGYDPTSGALIGTLMTGTSTPFAVPGLWGIAFGNDADNQPHNTLFYAAGPNNEANGQYGRVDIGTPVLNAPPVATVVPPSIGVPRAAAVVLTANATASVPMASVEFFAGTTSLGVITSSPYTVNWNTTAITDGTAMQLTATARDVDGNVGTSAAVEVTVGSITLTQVQTEVFSAQCTVCHDGSSTTVLPGVQNLTAGNAYTNIVNVTSLEAPTLKRIKPNDVANSYMIQKLMGAPGISGVQMPKGGTPLPQATIDRIKTWINNGAPNN
ncbi:MAG: TIGR03118 family protein, partial [Proteobacteria bacterium]|nr:TIGR03118 family protein [Pseudomonadota bacterium]